MSSEGGALIPQDCCPCKKDTGVRVHRETPGHGKGQCPLAKEEASGRTSPAHTWISGVRPPGRETVPPCGGSCLVGVLGRWKAKQTNAEATDREEDDPTISVGSLSHPKTYTEHS